MEINTVYNPPNAASLMMTARSFGNYDLASAIADLIDNSIKAKSSCIEILCLFNSGKPEVRIRDNGLGMSKDELFNAMRPASKNPNEERSPDDLGRFGWGMKSASFSQCSILTVISKNSGLINGASWDLNNIDNWAMSTFENNVAEKHLLENFIETSGTEVIWTNCDRLSENFRITQEQFNDLVVAARRKLSLIFHRFLEKSLNNKFEILVNGTPLDLVDPFCQDHPATITFPEELISLPLDTQIKMQAFTLPHFSKLTNNQYEEYGGEEGYVKNQGFYVYRNKRLIIHGTWFRLVKHGELSKLVRVRIDIPNSLDEMWKITVDKSDAQLPVALRARMKNLVNGFRTTSSKVFRSKGAKIDDTDKSNVWMKHVKDKKIKYSINKKHPFILGLFESLTSENQEKITTLIQMIEIGVPVDAIFNDVSSDPLNIFQTFSSRQEIDGFLNNSIPLMMASEKTLEKLIEKLKATEPYSSNWIIVEEYLKESNIL